MDNSKGFAAGGVRRHSHAKGHAARLTLLAALLSAPLMTMPLPAHAAVSVGIGITIAPPALPVYTQPAAPAPGYIWTPGYWAWGPDGYYWVDGVWLMPPAIGMLWTPGWWGWSDGYYRWHGGYWGPQVGFYGGINYGFGYFGDGYVGGGWRGDHFYYNRAVTHVNITNIHNVYVDKTVIHNDRRNDPHDRISYNGGQGGRHAAPNSAQRTYAAQRHQTLPPMSAGQRGNGAPPNAQRLNTPSSNRGSNDQRSRVNTSARQDAHHPGQPRAPSPVDTPAQQDVGPRQTDRPYTVPGRTAVPLPANHGPSMNAGRNNRLHSRPPEAPQAQPVAGGAPERPGMNRRPAAPQSPRQNIRTQEFRPPRAEAQARQERQGAERPEHRGESPARPGRNDR